MKTKQTQMALISLQAMVLTSVVALLITFPRRRGRFLPQKSVCESDQLPETRPAIDTALQVQARRFRRSTIGVREKLLVRFQPRLEGRVALLLRVSVEVQHRRVLRHLRRGSRQNKVPVQQTRMEGHGRWSLYVQLLD